VLATWVPIRDGFDSVVQGWAGQDRALVGCGVCGDSVCKYWVTSWVCEQVCSPFLLVAVVCQLMYSARPFSFAVA